jgi:hypothetical protein
MHERGWPADDPPHARALRARDAVLSLVASVRDLDKRDDERPPWVPARGV